MYSNFCTTETVFDKTSFMTPPVYPIYQAYIIRLNKSYYHSVTDLRTDKYCILEPSEDWVQSMKHCVMAIGCCWYPSYIYNCSVHSVEHFTWECWQHKSFIYYVTKYVNSLQQWVIEIDESLEVSNLQISYSKCF